MRTTEEIENLIISIAEKDERIRGVILSGSRANPDCPPDKYQDFDIVYYVKDVAPFWNNLRWIEENFGRPSLLQTPESMKLVPPDEDGKYVYLMIFPDGIRIDLTVSDKKYVPDGEPAVILLDKDNAFPEININREYWYVKKPTQKLFDDCANEFHWCLNNVAKGIARDEIPFAMEMFNGCVRDMLIKMISWYIGSENDFRVSVGKSGKYFKKYLDENLYERYINTYTSAMPEELWAAVFDMTELFGEIAVKTAENLDFTYNKEEEKGILDYMNMVKADF